MARLRPAFGGRRVLLGVYMQDVAWVAELADLLGFCLVGVAALDSCMNSDLGVEGVPRFDARDSGELLRITGELRPDLLLANYLPSGLPTDLRADTLPLCPPLGFGGTLRIAETWARTLRRGPEGWRRDSGFAEQAP